MKQVVLIGDSIRMGYEATVREELDGEVEVLSSKANGGNSRNVLAHLEEWAISRNPDLVHLNCGLHDLRKDFDAETQAVPLEEYRKNVEEILQRLQRDTDARILWANTTPVNEAWHHERKGFDRFEADVDAYNREAAAVCSQLEIPVHDLYDVVLKDGRDKLLQEDGVHFKADGCALLGKAVARAIRDGLRR